MSDLVARSSSRSAGKLLSARSDELAFNPHIFSRIYPDFLLENPELSAIVTASSEAVGLLQMAESLGISLRARVMVDSSAALAVTQRKGNGKLRHVRVGELWVQQAAEDGELEYQKVKGSLNLADVCTKHLPGSQLWELIAKTSQEPRAGRATEALCKIEGIEHELYRTRKELFHFPTKSGKLINRHGAAQGEP